jgi:hypothetical protein
MKYRHDSCAEVYLTFFELEEAVSDSSGTALNMFMVRPVREEIPPMKTYYKSGIVFVIVRN